VGPDVCGEIEIADIGLHGEDPEWWLCEDSDAWVPARPRTAHKWSAGAVAVIGGSPGIAGAAVLAGRAALSFGAGSVRVIAPGGIASTVAAMDPGFTTTGVGTHDRFGPDDVGGVLAAVERFDVLALGPGLGPTQGFVPALIERWMAPWCSTPMGWAGDGRLDLRRSPTVVTPHAGGAPPLPVSPPRPGGASPARTGAVVLLKGAPPS
jgi:NAD(P)H-hydrate epimerase